MSLSSNIDIYFSFFFFPDLPGTQRVSSFVTQLSYDLKIFSGSDLTESSYLNDLPSIANH